MNFLYVVVSGLKDTYLEQTILSIESLKKVDPKATVSVVIDQGTEQTLTGKRHKIYDIADKIIVITVPDEYNNKNRSRFLKTTMYDYADKDFLYIDGDTIVCEDLSGVAGDYDMAGVLDLHMPISTSIRRKRIERRAARCGFHAGYDDKHFNGGFMWVRKCARSEEFFRTWHELWKEALTHGVTLDQASLNEANYRLGGIIHEMDGTWNCQLRRFGTGLQYLHDAKMIHYFASNKLSGVPYDLSNNDLLRHALDDKYPEELQRILDNPKAALRGVKFITSDPLTSRMINSHLFTLIQNTIARFTK